MRNLDFIEGMAPEESRLRVDAMLRGALRPLTVGALDPDSLTTVSRTEFDPEVVKAVAWKPGMCVIWDNAMWLHSTTPTGLYTKGRRVMYQIIMGK